VQGLAFHPGYFTQLKHPTELNGRPSQIRPNIPIGQSKQERPSELKVAHILETRRGGGGREN